MSDKARQICDDVRRLVKYKPDARGTDTWQRPSVTERLRTGDCEDFAILILSRCRKARIKARMVLCYSATGGHAVVAGDGWFGSNAIYSRTNNLADSVRRQMQWKSIKTIEVTDSILRRKGVRL